MTLAHHLVVAGILQWLLVLVNTVVPRRFHWKEESGRLSLFNRQVLYVHMIFIVLMLVLFGGLSIFYAPVLAAATPLAAPILGGLAFFWGLRLIFQLFFYSPKIWRGNRFYTIMHVVFTTLWIYLTGVYAVGFVQHVGWIA